ncbi:MAG: pilW1 [Herbaspirillum sp.]|jgi:type IV pilus assembly protein PilW|nr:pilW1 [Herbaspirillum sp.]
MKRRIRINARQRGLTLIECMISLALGMIVILAASSLLLSAQQAYLAIDDSARIDDAGAFALAALGAAIRQAAYADRSQDRFTPLPGKPLFGIDDLVLKAKSATFDSRQGPGINGSDVLVTRFMATDAAGAIDGDMRNCAGAASHSPVLPLTVDNADRAYNWSIFYIAPGAGGEPELFCKYRNRKDEFNADAIVRGVEAMQFLYGVDLNGDGLPESFLNATAIDAMDRGRPSPVSHWSKVVAVHIALSVRGNLTTAAASDGTAIHHLFGAAYSALHAASDPGVRLDIGRLRPFDRHRTRRIFHGMVMLHNRIGGE